MSPNGQTEMGGHDGEFHSTHWTNVLRAGAENDTSRREALNTLLEQYWKPVYCYLRRKGNDNETAKDLTQGFFQEVALDRDLIRLADPSKGRFRSLLLTALNRYTTDQHRRRMAEKRMPIGGLVSLEKLGDLGIADRSVPEPPDDAFNHVWAFEILNEVLAAVRNEYVLNAKEAHWCVFHARLVAPITDHVEPTPFPALCAQHGVTEKEAYNMLGSVKRRFQMLLRERVGQSVGMDDGVDEKEIDSEIDDLVRALSKRPA